MMKRDHLYTFLLGIIFLMVWEVTVHIAQTSPLVLPAPSAVMQSLWQGLQSGYLLPHIVYTLSEVLLGLFIGAFLGFIGGVMLGESARARTLMMPTWFLAKCCPSLHWHPYLSCGLVLAYCRP